MNSCEADGGEPRGFSRRGTPLPGRLLEGNDRHANELGRATSRRIWPIDSFTTAG